jgi:hypothetical protein
MFNVGRFMGGEVQVSNNNSSNLSSVSSVSSNKNKKRERVDKPELVFEESVNPSSSLTDSNRLPKPLKISKEKGMMKNKQSNTESGGVIKLDISKKTKINDDEADEEEEEEEEEEETRNIPTVMEDSDMWGLDPRLTQSLVQSGIKNFFPIQRQVVIIFIFIMHPLLLLLSPLLISLMSRTLGTCENESNKTHNLTLNMP